MTPLHPSLDDRVRLSLKKNRKKRKNFCLKKKRKKTKNKKQAQCLLPVIPALWKAEKGRSPEARSSRPVEGETSTLRKTQKLARHGGTCL